MLRLGPVPIRSPALGGAVSRSRESEEGGMGCFPDRGLAEVRGAETEGCSRVQSGAAKHPRRKDAKKEVQQKIG